MPRVSICVPNLNTRPFLPERFRTIAAQTFQDWELLAYDSYSTDGAWDYLLDLASREPRMRAWQGPREGTPGSWTPCVREARGEYVYIATSDDTMAADCLEKLVGALDEHPECDIAHCPLRPIDEHGNEVTAISEAWRQQSMFALGSGALLHVRHVRRAPFDGLLHLLGGSVYISITQLLIRRSLFDRVGYFQRRWGSVGDFNWSMRAGLAADVVHVPDTWGGWRVHASQATADVAFTSPEHARKVDDMIEDALAACGVLLAPQLRERLPELAFRASRLRAFTREVAGRSAAPAGHRRVQLLRDVLTGSRPARDYVTLRLLGRSPADWVRGSMARIGCTPELAPVGVACHPSVH